MVFRLRVSHGEEAAALAMHAQALAEAEGHVRSQQRWGREGAAAAHACAQKCVELGVVRCWAHGTLCATLAAAAACLRGGGAVGALLWAAAALGVCAAKGAGEVRRWRRVCARRGRELRRAAAHARQAEEEAAGRPARAAAEAAAAARALRPSGPGSGSQPGLGRRGGGFRSQALAAMALRRFCGPALAAAAVRALARRFEAPPFGAALAAAAGCTPPIAPLITSEAPTTGCSACQQPCARNFVSSTNAQCFGSRACALTRFLLLPFCARSAPIATPIARAHSRLVLLLLAPLGRLCGSALALLGYPRDYPREYPQGQPRGLLPTKATRAKML